MWKSESKQFRTGSGIGGRAQPGKRITRKQDAASAAAASPASTTTAAAPRVPERMHRYRWMGQPVRMWMRLLRTRGALPWWGKHTSIFTPIPARFAAPFMCAAALSIDVRYLFGHILVPNTSIACIPQSKSTTVARPALTLLNFPTTHRDSCWGTNGQVATSGDTPSGIVACAVRRVWECLQVDVTGTG